MTEEQMVSEFLNNGGTIKQCENPFGEYSKFGGKTRSHLDHSDIITGERLMPKHKYEGKVFEIKGVIKVCTAHLVKRSKIGSLLSHFKFTDGKTYTEAHLTKMINNKTALIIDAN